MAAQSPSSSSPIKAVSSTLNNKAMTAARQPGVSKSDLTNEATTDQQWLEESQQAWAEQRAKEQELARAEKLGDRVLQLLEGEQVGGVIGESLVVAQAKPAEEERKAVPPPKDDDGGGFWWPALGLGVLGAAIGRHGGGTTAPDPGPGPGPGPDPFVAGDELLVYTNETGNDNGDRHEVGSTDTNTDEGPYQTVRVKAVGVGDTGLLDDGVGVDRSLYVEFDARDDLSLDVWAQGRDSSATADINTDSLFEGEISVVASGRDSLANLYLDVTDGSGDAELVGTMSVEASGRGADAYADVSVYGNGSANAIFSVDLSVSTSERYATASADIYVESESGDASLQGNIEVLAEGHDSSAEANIYVSADYTTVSGDYTTTSGEDGSATSGAAQWSAVAGDQDTTANLHAIFSADSTATFNLDLTAQASYGGADANVTLDIEANYIDLMGDQTWSGSFSSSDSSYTVSEGEDRAAAEFSSIADATDANSELELNMTADYVYANVDFTVEATENGNSNADTSTNATLDVNIDVADYAQLGGDWSFTVSCGDVWSEDDSSTTNTYTGSVGEDMTAAEWTSTAAGDTAYAGLYLNVESDSSIDIDFDIDMSANLSVVATDGAFAETDILLNDVANLNDVSIQGDSSWSVNVTAVSHEADNGDSVGEDTTVTFAVSQGAADWTAVAGSGACADLYVDISADGYVDMLANLGATAGDDAYAITHLDLETSGDIDIAGSLSVNVVGNYTSSDYVAYTESVSGEDSTMTLDAASWMAEANAHHGEAYVAVDISNDGSNSDVRVAADLTSAASATETTSWLSVDIQTNGFVEMNGGYSSTDSWSEGDLSGDISVDQWAWSSTEYAAEWQDTASGTSAEAYNDVHVSADSIEVIANNTVTASGTDSIAESFIELSADGDIHIGGEWTLSGGEEFGVTSDTTFDSVNAEWTVTASGTGSYGKVELDATTYASGDIDLDMNVSATASGDGSLARANLTALTDGTGDITMGDADHSVLTVTATGGGEATMSLDLDGHYVDFSGDFTLSASGDDSVSYLSVDMDASSDVDYMGDITATAADGSSQTDMDMGLHATSDVNFTGDLTLAATGDGSHGDLYVDATAGDNVDFTSDVSVTASGSSSEALVTIDMTGGTDDADESVTFNGDITVTAEGSNSDTHMDLSMYGEDLTYDGDTTLTASGSDTHGQLSVNITTADDYDNTVDFSGNTTFTAEGSNSLVSTDYFLLAGGSVDYTGDITIAASGSNSYIGSDFGLVAGEDVNYNGDITVQAGGESGLDSDAVVHMSLDARDGDAGFDGVVSVTAEGADNSATVFVNVFAGDVATMGGDLNVTALNDGQATVTVNVSDDFNSDISLDADQGGDVNVTVSAYSMDSNIDVWTDNSGKVTLNLDIVDNAAFNGSSDIASSDFDSAITVHGAAGEFDLVLQNGGFDVAVDLESANYGGTFNLTVDDPVNFSSSELSADFAEATYIAIDGFDVTVDLSSPGIDHINFAGLAYAGDYIDATTYNGTGASDEYSNEYNTLDDLLAEANDALVSDASNDVDYFFGVVDGNGYLAVDGNGDGVDYIIELVGVTAFNWDSLTSTSGIYTETPV